MQYDMTGGSSPITSKGPLVPILTMAAAGLCALVWIVPLPMLKAPVAPKPPPARPVEAPKTESSAPLVKAEEWEPLVEPLDSLREKAVEPAVADTSATEVPVAPTQEVPRMPPLAWQFKGTIDGPGSRAALVMLSDGRSRFVFVGQELEDQSNPGGPMVVIREIAVDFMLVARGDVEERLPLQKSELAMPFEGRMSTVGMGR
jgi:hypothetical protein